MTPIRRTRISGWKLVGRDEPNKPFEVFAKGHISPEIAIAKPPYKTGKVVQRSHRMLGK